MRSLLFATAAVLLVSGGFAQRRPPNYSQDNMPETSFDCRDKDIGGYYADPEAECQMFHVCVKMGPSEAVQDFRFLCPNDTMFDQENQICANWFDIDCEASTLYYSKSFDLFRVGHGPASDDVLQRAPEPVKFVSVKQVKRPQPPKPAEDEFFRTASSSDIHRGRDEEDESPVAPKLSIPAPKPAAPAPKPGQRLVRRKQQRRLRPVQPQQNEFVSNQQQAAVQRQESVTPRVDVSKAPPKDLQPPLAITVTETPAATTNTFAPEEPVNPASTISPTTYAAFQARKNSQRKTSAAPGKKVNVANRSPLPRVQNEPTTPPSVRLAEEQAVVNQQTNNFNQQQQNQRQAQPNNFNQQQRQVQPANNFNQQPQNQRQAQPANNFNQQQQNQRTAQPASNFNQQQQRQSQPNNFNQQRQPQPVNNFDQQQNQQRQAQPNNQQQQNQRQAQPNNFNQQQQNQRTAQPASNFNQQQQNQRQAQPNNFNQQQNQQRPVQPANNFNQQNQQSQPQSNFNQQPQTQPAVNNFNQQPRQSQPANNFNQQPTQNFNNQQRQQPNNFNSQQRTPVQLPLDDFKKVNNQQSQQFSQQSQQFNSQKSEQRVNQQQQFQSFNTFSSQQPSSPSTFSSPSSFGPSTLAPSTFSPSSPAPFQSFQSRQSVSPKPFQLRRSQRPRENDFSEEKEDELLRTAHSSSFRASDLNAIQRSQVNAQSTFGAAKTVAPTNKPALSVSSPKPFSKQSTAFNTQTNRVPVTVTTLAPRSPSTARPIPSNTTPRSFVTETIPSFNPSSSSSSAPNSSDKPSRNKGNSDYDYAYYDDTPIDHEYEGVDHISEFSRTNAKKQG